MNDAVNNSNSIDRILHEIDTLLKRIRKAQKTSENTDLNAARTELMGTVEHLTKRKTSKLERLSNAEATFFNMVGYMHDLVYEDVLTKAEIEQAELIWDMFEQANKQARAEFKAQRETTRAARRAELSRTR